jgi:ethanolamine permease
VVASPFAGGGYAYARKALGKFWGFINGILKAGEFICFGAVFMSYLDTYLRMIHMPFSDIAVLVIFFTLIVVQSIGIRQAALLQLVMTCISISIFIMFVLGINSVKFSNFDIGTELAVSPGGLFIAVPFALWLYLGIDVTMLTAEETKNTAKNVPRNFLVSLSIVFILLMGILTISLNSISLQLLQTGKFPLVTILEQLQGNDRVLISVFSYLSLSAFIAGINGFITGYSRQVFALGRAGYLPPSLGKIVEKTKVPGIAVLSALAVLLLAEFVDVMIMIKIACIFALVSYLLTILSFLKMRHQDDEAAKERSRQRSYAYIALLMCLTLMACMIVYYYREVLIFLGLLILMAVYYRFVAVRRINNDAPEEAAANTEAINIIITDIGSANPYD